MGHAHSEYPAPMAKELTFQVFYLF